MRFAVLADAHIGRSIPLAVAEHRRRAFSEAFSRAVDAVVEAGVDYVFICGDLFERRTLRPFLVQFAHDELYRMARETEERHGKRMMVFIIRGNHDGRPQSDTLDYIKHPLADYLVVFDEKRVSHRDEKLHVVGLSYYDQIDRAFEEIAKPAFEGGDGMRVLMLHGFVDGYNEVPPYSSSVTIDQLASVGPSFVFAGHQHRRCPPRRLPGGGWMITPGSLEMYDFGEDPEKGFYLVEGAEAEPEFRWISIEPMHVMKQASVRHRGRRPTDWYRGRIVKAVEAFVEELRRAGKPGYVRVAVEGGLSEGFPSDIILDEVERLRGEEPLLLWADVDTMGLDLPQWVVRPEREEVDVAEFFSDLGEFAEEIREMHGMVRDALEEEASVQTGLLTPSLRRPLVAEWLRRFEGRRFGEGEE
ncbi:MAG: metallophosphoesterase family protein [Candidatus Bathyarchaeota archaeon]|nr:metallophosphoesterase family protein [Candidatus Bathyarchaeota archaeon]